MASDVVIIGAGAMARAHHAALRAAGVKPDVLGRGEASAAAFEAETGVRPSTGRLADQLAARNGAPIRRAVIAAPVGALAETCRQLLDAGAERVLLEKPGGVDAGAVTALARATGSDRVRIAYNRRFLTSVLAARAMIEADGGVTSFLVEFNENIPAVRSLDAHGEAVKRNWFFANSTHVVDLAFFLAGAPQSLPEDFELHPIVRDGDAGPPPGGRYAGAGVCGGAAFAYHADWSSAGRWGLEICTRERRLIFKPLETVSQIRRGSFKMDPVSLEEEPDGVKPGLAAMLKAFLETPDDGALLTLRAQADRLAAFAPMAGLESDR